MNEPPFFTLTSPFSGPFCKTSKNFLIFHEIKYFQSIIKGKDIFNLKLVFQTLQTKYRDDVNLDFKSDKINKKTDLDLKLN